MRKTSNSNAGMDTGPKQSTKVANTRRLLLIPKPENSLSEKDYRLVTCLNTSYKIFTGILAHYAKKHVVQTDLWEKSQMETCENVLGTVDQLLIDNAIMEEVRDHLRNLAFAYYEYQKPYDMLDQDWMLRV